MTSFSDLSKIIIVAADESGCIGKEGKLPWHFPSDLLWFKENTQNKIVIMGRKTYESVGKPLPNRYNIVITSKIILMPNPEIDLSKTCLVNSLDACWQHLAKKRHLSGPCFIIGGAKLYGESLSLADSIYLTKIKGNYNGDTFFPIWPLEEYGWKAVNRFERSNSDNLEFWEYKRT